jgi:acyl-CoA thioesterase-1
VALLEKRLAQEKRPATVVNASISGDTTAGGRARLPALLERHRPTLLVIELGGNAALRGMPPAQTQDNLLAMTRAGQATGAKVLLLGMQVPPNFGQDFARQFAAVYVNVSKSTQAGLVPFLLKGVADGPDPLQLFQSDRIHPSAEAHPLILNTVWPAIQKLIA